VRTERPVQLRVGIQVGEVQAERCRFKQKPLVVFEHRYPAQRVTAPMLVRLAVLALQHRQLVRLADLLQQPQHTSRAAWR
jgi:hypothetical protein